jgi:hypothetical protein
MDDCPKADQCFRYRAMPDRHMQNWFAGDPREDGACRFFYPLELGSGLLRLSGNARDRSRGQLPQESPI